MIKVGLTGGIGSGKSTVSAIFKEFNIPIIDADVIARDVLTIYPEIKTNIKNIFGESFFDEEDKLRRKELGNFIFEDEEKTKELENIFIPFIKKEIFDKIEELDNLGRKICIVDAPTLIEQGLNKEMDYNILVSVEIDTQVKRIRKRDNLSDEEIMKRIESQMPLDKKKKYVDYLICNDGDLENTRMQTIEILKILEAFGEIDEK